MIIRSFARRPNAFQCLSSASRCRVPVAAFARHLHRVPTLNNNHSEIQTNGIPGLFSPQGFEVAYTQYQQYVVDELNTATNGTPWENKEAKDLIIDFARDPEKAHLFNCASMALNNHFFFKNINTNPSVVSNPPTELVQHINKNFTSMETFRETFLGTAEAMFGPGFVWLVQLTDTNTRQLRILTTYLAGSPLSGAHYRRQATDMNTQSPESYQALNSVGSFGRAANVEHKPKKALGGVDCVPLLCVNTWQHAWLPDYGVRGKRQYLDAWWDRIDWNKVADVITIAPPDVHGGASAKFIY